MRAGVRIVQRPQPAPSADWPSHVPPLLRRVLGARGVTTPQEAELRLGGLLPPDTLGGLDRAVALLQDAIAQDRRITGVGDFDCDGATGTAVAVRGLRLLGARQIGFRVPHRLRHGYGLTPALVEDLVADAPDLLLTVDSGVACVPGIAAARARGWTVIVTDHHLPGPLLPDASAMVNPNLPGDGFPSKPLAGVGVVFYLLLALRRQLRSEGRLAAPEPDLGTLLDLVAVGTVADLVRLDHNNRILVAAGLRRLRSGRANPGLLALAQVAGRTPSRLTAADIGFAIGPRINAAGRLEDMGLGIACLLADDPGEAQLLAAQLDAINRERRDLQQSMVDDAELLLRDVALPSADGESGIPLALCLHDDSWHPGVVGLVASKLKERLHRPVVAFAPGGDDGLLRGSARSIPGFHIRDALAEIDARQPGLVARFGGHAMAAGLSLPPAHLEAFRDAFTAVAASRLTPDLLQLELQSDGPLAPHEFDVELAELLQSAVPWGQGFPEPLFDNVFALQGWRVVGERHLKLQLRGERSLLLDAIHFGGWRGAPPPDRLRVLYRLGVNSFRGERSVQLVVEHIEPA